MLTALLTISPIDAATAERLRSLPDPVVRIADSDPGYPCRQCLRDAAIGDELILVSFDPFTLATPYRTASPVFLHRHDCSARFDSAAVPEQLRRRRLSVRAFDTTEMMVAGEVTDGSELEPTLERLFSDPTVERVHIHNAGPGCFAARVDRVR
jgi:hypothetical protein